MSDSEEKSTKKRVHEGSPEKDEKPKEDNNDVEEEEEEWIGPLPSEATKPKKKKCEVKTNLKRVFPPRKRFK